MVYGWALGEAVNVALKPILEPYRRYRLVLEFFLLMLDKQFPIYGWPANLGRIRRYCSKHDLIMAFIPWWIYSLTLSFFSLSLSLSDCLTVCLFLSLFKYASGLRGYQWWRISRCWAQHLICSLEWSLSRLCIAIAGLPPPPPPTGHWRDFLDAVQPSGSKTRSSDPDAIYSAFAFVHPVEIMQEQTP